MEATYFRTSQRNGYYWLESSEHFSGTIIRICPEVLLNHYVAAVAIDSGTPWPDPARIAPGWEIRGDIEYSPLLDQLTHLHH